MAMLMKTTGMMLLLMLLTLLRISEAAWGMNDEKKVKLRDIDVLTLHHGKMTKGRRSQPVPQLECINQGTAPCTDFKPRVVQCINRGSDGYDVQWECKTDMDNTYRFGHIEVSCEGYDYPDDSYVLHGSCGLKYSLDYSKEGMHQGRHDYYGDSYSSTYNTHGHHKKSKSAFSSMIADILVYVGMGLIAYAFYKTCINPGHREGQRAYSSTNDDYPSDGGTGGNGYGWFGGSNQHNQPPPSSGYRYQDDASCRNRYAGSGGTGMGGGGFWTGAATGGLLGYMFGNRNGGWGGRRGGWGNTGGGWGGGGYSSGGFGGSSSGSGSSGTRTASGFGGTSRR